MTTPENSKSRLAEPTEPKQAKAARAAWEPLGYEKIDALEAQGGSKVDLTAFDAITYS